MSAQVKSQYDLVGIHCLNENGDDLMIVKANRGTIAMVMEEAPLGTSITFETIKHPSFGDIVIPVIRRGFKQCDTKVTRCLLQQLSG